MKPTYAMLLPISFLLACSSSSDDTAKSMTAASENWSKTYVDQMRVSLDANPEMTVINDLEAIAQTIDTSLLSPWKSAWVSGKSDFLPTRLQSESIGLNWTDAPQNLVRSMDGISEYRLELSSGVDQSQSYLSEFRTIDDFQLDLLSS